MTLTQTQLSPDQDFSLVLHPDPILCQPPSPTLPWYLLSSVMQFNQPWFTHIVMISLRSPIQALPTLPIPSSPWFFPLTRTGFGFTYFQVDRRPPSAVMVGPLVLGNQGRRSVPEDRDEELSDFPPTVGLRNSNSVQAMPCLPPGTKRDPGEAG